MRHSKHAVSSNRQTTDYVIDIAPPFRRARRRAFGQRRVKTTPGPIARGQLRLWGQLMAVQFGSPLHPRRLSRRAIGRSGLKPSIATIARELLSLYRMIRTLIYCLRLICSLCFPTEPTMHNSVMTLDVVEPSTFRCGAHRQSADVDKKFGQLKKHSIFRYETLKTCRFQQPANNRLCDRHCSPL